MIVMPIRPLADMLILGCLRAHSCVSDNYEAKRQISRNTLDELRVSLEKDLSDLMISQSMRDSLLEHKRLASMSGDCNRYWDSFTNISNQVTDVASKHIPIINKLHHSVFNELCEDLMRYLMSTYVIGYHGQEFAFASDSDD